MTPIEYSEAFGTTPRPTLGLFMGVGLDEEEQPEVAVPVDVASAHAALYE